MEATSQLICFFLNLCYSIHKTLIQISSFRAATTPGCLERVKTEDRRPLENEEPLENEDIENEDPLENAEDLENEDP